MIGFDISDLTGGRASIDDMVGDMVLDVTNKIALDAQKYLAMSTPRNTGRAAGGWEVIRAEAAFKNAEVINPVHYIVFLIEGHSKQAPKGWFDGAILTAVTFGG